MIAKSFARIHWQNLANFGILALEFDDAGDYDDIQLGDTLVLDGLHEALKGGDTVETGNSRSEASYKLRHQLSPRQVDMVLAGGRIPFLRQKLVE